MDNLQYNNVLKDIEEIRKGFKPCYKWITFNIKLAEFIVKLANREVLNLVING